MAGQLLNSDIRLVDISNDLLKKPTGRFKVGHGLDLYRLRVYDLVHDHE